jgi:hypothetical protein
MEIVKSGSVRRTIRAYSDRNGTRVLEIVEYDEIALPAPKEKLSRLEVVYLSGMSLLGYGVAIFASAYLRGFIGV